eukprot:6259009-Amphidinium_carterae.1
MAAELGAKGKGLIILAGPWANEALGDQHKGKDTDCKQGEGWQRWLSWGFVQVEVAHRYIATRVQSPPQSPLRNRRNGFVAL